MHSKVCSKTTAHVAWRRSACAPSSLDYHVVIAGASLSCCRHALQQACTATGTRGPQHAQRLQCGPLTTRS